MRVKSRITQLKKSWRVEKCRERHRMALCIGDGRRAESEGEKSRMERRREWFYTEEDSNGYRTYTAK